MARYHVDRLRYVGIAVPDFGTEREFIKGHWGLTEVATDGMVSYFTAEGTTEPFIFRVRSAPERRVDVLSFSAKSAEVVDGLASQVASRGVKMISEPRQLNSPGDGYGFRFFDLDGRTIEVSSDVKARKARELEHGESIPAKLSHIVLHTPDIEKAIGFYHEYLGFKVSDWLQGFMCFMRCNQFHHTVGFMSGGPSLNHVAFDMRDIEEFMRGTGRLLKVGVPLQWGPGRHVLGNNTFSYFADPSGNVLEYTFGLEILREPHEVRVLPMIPENGDQWGTGTLATASTRVDTSEPDSGLWKAPPV